jgi:hypothetical protein
LLCHSFAGASVIDRDNCELGALELIGRARSFLAVA